MRASLQRRMLVAMTVSLAAGFLVSIYILIKFHGYEDAASRVMSGDQRAVIQGRLIEARISAAIEMAQGSANSEEANRAFRDRLVAISDDFKSLSQEQVSRGDRSLDEAKTQLSALISTKSEPVEDLFMQYRNIKTTAFNLYRLSWVNKWMGMAHGVGLIINDLDNMPYHAGENAAAGLVGKVNTLLASLPHAPMTQDAKMSVAGQLGTIKTQVAGYGESIRRASGVRATRAEGLKGLLASTKKHNDLQGHTMLDFGNEARTEVFKALIAFLLFVLFAMGWWTFSAGRFSKHLTLVVGHLVSQLEGWISTSGSLTAAGFEAPEKPDAELTPVYRAVDQTMRRMGSIRKEDILVKRLLNVPFVLVNKNKQAIFWNSAMSILAKVRALEETGPVTYANLMRFTSVQGKVTDPIEKAFTENKEITQLALLRIGEDGLAVQATCTPVQGPEHQTDYVMVHIRDLRDENRRAEAELDRQLECVRTAIEFVKQGKVPPEPGPSLRRPVLDAIAALKAHALELGEKATVMAGQVDTMRGRMNREAGLKKTVYGRMEQVKGEISALRERLESLRNSSDRALSRVSQVDNRGAMLKTEYDDVKRRASQLGKDLSESRTLVTACIRSLELTEEISGRVRANERLIQSLLEKSAVLNANNSILGSKRELTPTDVVSITENITQVMNQFDRSYRLIKQSVDEVEKALGNLSGKLRENLSACERLANNDHDIVRALNESEKLVRANAQEANEFVREMNALKSTGKAMTEELKGLEVKTQALCQIGQASVALQSQLEMGFEGMFGALGSSENAGAKLGGSA